MSKALWKRIQSFLGIAADGIPGPQTAGAVAAAWAQRPGPTFDARSEKNIATLVPAAQAKARECRSAAAPRGST